MDERLIAMRENAKDRGEPILRDKSFALLIKTVKEKAPKSILEIGVNEGLSGVAMLLSAKDAHLTGIEIDEEKASKARENYRAFGVENRAKIFLGDSSEIIPLLSGKYDFIFLDGPKGHYGEYCDNLISALNVNGVLFADNVLYRGYVGKDKKAPHRHATIKHSIENFLDKVTGDKRLKTVVYDIEDGVSVTEKLYE
ncbi:MAG: class I SAM-dependent methyltransferase [Clostridia bacterium]|nr:class I SAM-dependent methyltransferase [Clostridia bacterium]